MKVIIRAQLLLEVSSEQRGEAAEPPPTITEVFLESAWKGRDRDVLTKFGENGVFCDPLEARSSPGRSGTRRGVGQRRVRCFDGWGGEVQIDGRFERGRPTDSLSAEADRFLNELLCTTRLENPG
jgi:hypothetical protein